MWPKCVEGMQIICAPVDVLGVSSVLLKSVAACMFNLIVKDKEHF